MEHNQKSSKKSVNFAKVQFSMAEDGIEEFEPLKGATKDRIKTGEVKQGKTFSDQEITERIANSEATQAKAHTSGDLQNSSRLLEEKIQEMEKKKAEETNNNSKLPSTILNTSMRGNAKKIISNLSRNYNK